MRSGSNRVGKKRDKENIYFKHKLKPVKLGVMIHDKEKLYKKIEDILKKYATNKEDKLEIKSEVKDK